MSFRLVIIVGCMWGGLCTLQAQDTRGNNTAAPAPVYQAAKKQSFFKRVFGSGNTYKSKRTLPYEDQEAFEKRMKQVAKQKKKEGRQAAKPQAANVEYFGHKKPPKKRPRGKKKFCKECGIRH